jgi:hypothetical protein
MVTAAAAITAVGTIATAATTTVALHNNFHFVQNQHCDLIRETRKK